MSVAVLIPTLTSLLALVLAIALFDQWRERRHAFQLIWGLGMLFYGIAAATEAIGAGPGWNELLYRVWYLTGAVWTAGWLGLGTAILLARTRFGYAFALCLGLAGLFTLLTQQKYDYAGSGFAPLAYFLVALVVAIAVAVETYFENARWPYLAGAAIVGATLLSIVVTATITLPAPGFALDPATNQPVPSLFPGSLRLLTPWLNVTGGLSLVLGAFFSAYIFMPKRRVLAYSLDPDQTGDQFLFNLLISIVAISVNFVASLPGALRALVAGRLHSRVAATILIALGGLLAGAGDTATRFGNTEFFGTAKLAAAVFLFVGFLVSIEAFHEIRVPFTRIRLGPARAEVEEHETAEAHG